MNAYMDVLVSFNGLLAERLSFGFRRYQKHVARDVINVIRGGSRFVVVSMPTGSGKTFIELFIAFYSLEQGFSRVLVLEPTRFLCDQMYRGLWSKVFGNLVGKEYEGNCGSFLEFGKRIIISTPQTALKCISMLKEKFKVVVIDEVHHAFGGRYYAELLVGLKPAIVVGFTALLPSHKRYRLDPKVRDIVGEPYILSYDFKKLEEIDPEFRPPKAVADVFDAEMNDCENKAYDALFRALPQGNSQIIKFLEVTLARYGKEAFCESYKKALEKNRIMPNNYLEDLCRSSSLSHKARILIDILTIYDIRESDELKPVLIFTSRKATANEFKKAIVHYVGLPEEKVIVLTSDISREERLKLVKKARSREVDVIISTLVGEEGVDIPETGLLIMTDTPKSPLRFYQRLGRLIRMSSQRKIKYLVISLTPKTIEYQDLEDALWNLYMEGIDISYIVINIGEKSPSARVLDIINEFTRVYNDASIPYMLLAFGREYRNPLNFILAMIKNRQDLVTLIQEHMRKWGVKVEVEEDLDKAIYHILTFHMLRWGNVKKIFDPIDKAITRSRFGKELNQIIREGKIFYIYDPEMLSEVISRKLRILYQRCLVENKGICIDEFFRIDRKSILRLFARIFPYDNINYIITSLKQRKEKHRKYLEIMNNSFLKHYDIWVSIEGYSDHSMTLTPKVIIRLELDNYLIGVDAQINYHDISRKLYEDVNIKKLIEENLLVIGYEASKQFLEQIHEANT